MYSRSPSVEVQTDPPIVHYTECPTDMTSDLIVGMQSEINRITAQNVMLKEQINSFEFNEKMFTHVMVLFSFSTIWINIWYSEVGRLSRLGLKKYVSSNGPIFFFTVCRLFLCFLILQSQWFCIGIFYCQMCMFCKFVCIDAQKNLNQYFVSNIKQKHAISWFLEFP